MKIPKSVREYMELVAGCVGDDAIKKWLFFRESFRGRERVRPRYVRSKATGELEQWTEDLRRGDDGFPAGYTMPSDGELLAHVVGLVEGRK